MLRATLLALLVITLGLACAAPPTSSAEHPAMAESWDAPPLERAVSVRDGHTGEEIELEAFLDWLARADVVFLGETHTDETTHRVELAVFEGLLERRSGRVALALEMFERDVQPALDAYLAGSIDEQTFLSRARPWSNYQSAYRPLIECARQRGAPAIASNFPAPLRRRMASEGVEVLAELPEEERRQVPAELLPNSQAYWRRVDNAIRGHVGMMGPRPAPDDPRLEDTQSLWDNSMGETCARALDEHPGFLVLHVNGGFHSEYWDGTARQLRLRKPEAKVLTVAIDPSTNPSVEELGGIPRADYVVFAESRAKDVEDGEYAVIVPRELKYRLHVPAEARESSRVPLLIWLGEDGATAREELAEWKERVGECAIAVIEAPYRETQEDLVEGGRWFWPDSFDEDIASLAEGIERAWAFILRHEPIDPARVCLAGEGTGATVVSSVALFTGRMDVRAVALSPRRYSKIKDFPLPLPELAGDGDKPEKSLRVLVAPRDAERDEDWWSSEIEEYRGIGFPSKFETTLADPWLGDLERENAVRAALQLEPLTVDPSAPRRYVLAESPRARMWSRRLALRHRLETGELVAVFDSPPAEAGATEISTALRASDFQAERPLPRCPGPFGGTTVVALPADAAKEEVQDWLALEQEDPLAQSSRFHRLRVALDSGDRALPEVLAKLLEEGRKNVLIVPAVFCADAARMRELKQEVRELEDRMTIAWQPGLGSLAGE